MELWLLVGFELKSFNYKLLKKVIPWHGTTALYYFNLMLSFWSPFWCIINKTWKVNVQTEKRTTQRVSISVPLRILFDFGPNTSAKENPRCNVGSVSRWKRKYGIHWCDTSRPKLFSLLVSNGTTAFVGLPFPRQLTLRDAFLVLPSVH